MDSLRRQGFTVDYDPIKAGAALLSGPEIKETTVNGFTLGAFTIGCYECYGDTNERVKTDGVFAAACNSQATGCLVIQIEGPENDFESTKNLFVNQLFPTIKIAENFNTIQCIQNPGKG